MVSGERVFNLIMIIIIIIIVVVVVVVVIKPYSIM